MKKNKGKGNVSRRQFIGAGTAATVLTAGVLTTGCSSKPTPMATGVGKPNSKFGGVQIGASTYSIRGINPSNVDELLKACIEAGLSSIEFRQTNLAEEFCGAPKLKSAPPRPGQRGYERYRAQQERDLTEEEYAELEKQAADSREALKQWRLSAPMDKFAELAQMYRDAGVNIHLMKWTPASWSPEEIDYAFKANKAMNVMGITEEMRLETAKKMGPIAEKYGLYAVMHNHYQYAEEGFNVDDILAVSPGIMLNFDVGHYWGSTGLNPCDFIEKYHDRIYSLHIKDKTGLNTEPPNANQVWGQGDTPLEEILLLIKNKYPQIYCDIELEYRIAAWSNSVKETRTCVNYARNILI